MKRVRVGVLSNPKPFRCVDSDTFPLYKDSLRPIERELVTGLLPLFMVGYSSKYVNFKHGGFSLKGFSFLRDQGSWTTETLGNLSITFVECPNMCTRDPFPTVRENYPRSRSHLSDKCCSKRVRGFSRVPSKFIFSFRSRDYVTTCRRLWLNRKWWCGSRLFGTLDRSRQVIFEVGRDGFSPISFV